MGWQPLNLSFKLIKSFITSPPTLIALNRISVAERVSWRCNATGNNNKTYLDLHAKCPKILRDCKKKINFTGVNLNAYCSDYDIEICAFKLHYISFHIRVFSIYRATTGNFTQLLHKVCVTLRFLYSSEIEYIICENINITYLMIVTERIKLTANFQ